MGQKEEKFTKETEKGDYVLTPKNDVIFQTLFSKGNEEITKSLISSIIKQEITYIEMDVATHLKRKYAEDKLGILDLRVKLQDNIQCNIEVQMIDRGNISERMLFYQSKQFASQIVSGNDYTLLHKTISIAILNFELPETKSLPFCTNWKIIEDKKRQNVLTDKLDLYIIELPVLMREKNKKLSDSLTQWMLFLDNPKSEEVQEIMKKNDNIKKAVDEFDKITKDKELRRIAELREKAILDENSMLSYAERKGLKKGKNTIAKNMLNKGVEIEFIKEVTGLTDKEIEELKQDKK